MAKHSEYTKKAYRRCWLLRAIDFAIIFGPFIYEVIKAIIAPYSTQQKVVVLGTTAVAFILCLFNLIAQKHLRSPLWIIFLGLYFSVKDLIPVVIWVAVASSITSQRPLLTWQLMKDLELRLVLVNEFQRIQSFKTKN